MSSTNKTTNYNLSQFVGTDIPSILNDYNGDMLKIDTAVHNVSVASGDNASNIASLQSTIGGHTNQIAQIDSNVTAVSGRVLTVEGEVTDIENRVSTTENDIENIETVIPSSASSSNKLVTNKLTLVQSFTRNNNEKLDDYMLRIGSKIKELVDDGNSIKNIAIKCVYPSSHRGFLTLEEYNNESVLYSKLAITQNIVPHLYYFPTITSNKEYATIKEIHLRFANSYVPGETTSDGTVLGYEITSDFTAEPSALGTMQYDVYVLN